MNWEDINIQFGNTMRRLWEGRGYSQEKFAALCGISRAYYGRLERGEHSVTLDRCRQIANALGLALYELFIDLP